MKPKNKNDERLIYIVNVKSLSGPDWNFQKLVLFTAKNDQDAKKSFVNAVLESEINCLHNGRIFETDFSDEFIKNVLEDEFWDQWTLEGNIVGKYPCPDSLKSGFKYKSILLGNESWSFKKSSEKRKKGMDNLRDILGKIPKEITLKF